MAFVRPTLTSSIEARSYHRCSGATAESMTAAQPRGASVEDTVRWARWFLSEYREEFPERPLWGGGQ